MVGRVPRDGVGALNAALGLQVELDFDLEVELDFDLEVELDFDLEVSNSISMIDLEVERTVRISVGAIAASLCNSASKQTAAATTSIMRTAIISLACSAFSSGVRRP